MTMTPEQRADRIHEIIRANPEVFLSLGDTEKPFHENDCDCEVCEHWRRQMNRPTRAELRKEVEGGD